MQIGGRFWQGSERVHFERALISVEPAYMLNGGRWQVCFKATKDNRELTEKTILQHSRLICIETFERF